MNIEPYLAFVAVSAVLIVIPGPNVLVVVSTALRDGCRPALLTVAGTSTAMAIQLAVAVGGLTSLLLVLTEWFEVLRWGGVAYLACLGVQTLREGGGTAARPRAAPLSKRRAFSRGFLVSLTNPKTMLFFAAFLPQFVDPAQPAGNQLYLLASTFLVIAVVVDGGYALAASRALRDRLAEPRLRRWRARISGSLFLGARVGLALARRQ